MRPNLKHTDQPPPYPKPLLPSISAAPGVKRHPNSVIVLLARKLERALQEGPK